MEIEGTLWFMCENHFFKDHIYKIFPQWLDILQLTRQLKQKCII